MKNLEVHLYEHPVFYDEFAFSKIRLIFIKSATLSYLEELKTNKIKTVHHQYPLHPSKITAKITHIVDPCDKKALSDTILQFPDAYIIESPLFITDLTAGKQYFDDLGDKQFNHASFYIWQRTRLNILLEENGKPIGGKWSFDTENRKKFPKNLDEPPLNDGLTPSENENMIASQKWVSRLFSENPGYVTDISKLPFTRRKALKILDDFVKHKLLDFGKYQDAVSPNNPIGYHSLLSPALNTGLLTPGEVVDKILRFYNGLDSSKLKKDYLPSVEGFVRQIIGWREAVRLFYVFKSEMMTSNVLKHHNTLNDWWFYPEKNTDLSTKIPIINHLVEKVSQIGYLHHIERLMYIGNWMLLTKIDPNEVYRWFMCMFVDSYNWVMAANVYSMSQFATGKLMMGRPYFSSSAYIVKMTQGGSNNTEWRVVWDAYYYRFLEENREMLEKIYSTASQVKLIDKLSKKRREEFRKVLNN